MAADHHPSGGRSGHRLISIMVAACLLLLTPGLAVDRSFAADHTVPTLRAWQRSHEGHLTIEWPDTVRVQQKRNGDLLVLRFAEPLGVDARSTLQDLSTFIDPVRSRAQGTDISLALKPGVSSNVSLRERRIVAIDFIRDPTAAPLSRIEASTIDGGVRLLLTWPGPTQVEADQLGDELRLLFAPAWDIDSGDLARLRQNLRPWLDRIDLEQGRDGQGLSVTLQPHIVSSLQSDGPTRTIVDLKRQAAIPSAQATAPLRHVFIPEKRPQIAGATDNLGPSDPPQPKFRPKVTSEPEVIADATSKPLPETPLKAEEEDLPKAIVIDWKKPVGAAIFLRAGHLWAIFDETDAGLLAGVPRAPAAFEPGSFVPVEGGTALRFPLREDVDISAYQLEDGQWRIEPAQSSTKPKAVTIERIDASSALRISPTTGGRIVRIIDPAVGDRIDVLPLSEAGIGQPRRQRFVDLDLLPTMQGLAWRPMNDRLMSSVDEQGLEFRGQKGLALSNTSPDTSSSEPVILEAMVRKPSEGEVPSDPVAETPPSQPPVIERTRPIETAETPPASYVDLAGSGVERELVNEYRRIRRQAIGKALPEKRDQARLDLARLLVSERLATEARTVLDTIPDDAASGIMLQKRALSGVVAFLTGHPTEASSILLDSELDEDDEIDLWRAALESTDAKWQAAAERWRTKSDVLDAYPPRLKLDLGLMALRSAIETDDDKMMQQGLRRLSSLSLNPYDQARFDAMKALRAERSGDLERARSLLTGLTESPNHALRTQARFDLASLDLKAHGPDAGTLATLDRDLPLWRGHPDERELLDRLARRHVDAHALRRALMVWRRLIHLFPDAADDQDLKLARQDVFMQALTKEDESSLDPLDIYAIYLDFTDLLPGDPEARAVHRHLAGHLAKLELLDEAIDVLQSLMTSSTDDSERVDIATDMASLMLLGDRAAPALAMLDATEAPSAARSAAFLERRQLLRARALARLDRADDALRTLQDLTSPSARRLRAEILWDERRWPRLAAAVESYFAAVDPASPLAQDDRELVLWLALARAKENAPDKLRALRERFGSAMQGGDYAEDFEVATQRAIKTKDIKDYLTETGEQIAELQRYRNAISSSR
ncbi:MAG: hypothetical protein R3F54_12955 [Alphaproteobacteria bacterium]